MTRRRFYGLLLLAPILAGAYGALHDQVSYTIAPHYFHEAKFDQFRIPDTLRNRAGASIVGFLASWWMGFVIATPLLALARFRPGPANPVLTVLRAYLAVGVTTLLIGLAAFVLIVFFERSDKALSDPALRRRQAFDDAGFLHEASYAGGLIGLLSGAVTLWRAGSRRDESAA